MRICLCVLFLSICLSAYADVPLLGYTIVPKICDEMGGMKINSVTAGVPAYTGSGYVIIIMNINDGTVAEYMYKPAFTGPEELYRKIGSDYVRIDYTFPGFEQEYYYAPPTPIFSSIIIPLIVGVSYQYQIGKYNNGAGATEFSPVPIPLNPVVDNSNAPENLVSLSIEYLCSIGQIATITAGGHPFGAPFTQGSYSAFLDGVPQNIINSNGYNGYITGPFSIGDHTVRIKDKYGCTSNEQPFTVVENPVFYGFSTSVLRPPCPNSCDGSFAINIAPGSGSTPLQYRLVLPVSGNYVALTPFQASNTFSNICPGITTWFEVRTANGCSFFHWKILDAVQLTPGTPSTTSPSCIGQADGQISLNNSFASHGPLTYALNTGGFQAGNVFTNLQAGTYSITIKDYNNCTATVSDIQVADPIPVSADYTVVQEDCPGSGNGSITMNPAGGTGPYQFSINNSNVFQNANVFNNLHAGNYPITIKDANNCIYNTSVTIPPTTAITGMASITSNYNGQHISCIGSTNGQLSILNPGGGTGELSFKLNDGVYQGSPVFNGVGAGDHTLTIQDANGCTNPLAITINNPPDITASASPAAASCYNGTNGAISVTASGGTPSYQYSIDGNGFQGSNILNNLAAGVYPSVTVKDANNCTKILSQITVAQPNAVAASVASINHAVCNGANGAITMHNVSGGNGNYFYSTNNIDFNSNPVLSRTAGLYTITVRDGNGCVNPVPIQALITQPTAISASISTSLVNCHGGSDGSISVWATGGTGSYSYTLDNVVFQNTNSFAGLSAASYTVRVRDSNLCMYTTNATVTQPTQLGGNITQQTPISCAGYSNGALNLTHHGGTGPYSFLWSTGDNTEDIEEVGAGTYSVEITDANLCNNIVEYTLTDPLPLSAFGVLSNYNGTHITCSGATDGAIDVTVSGGTIPYTYQWTHGSVSPDVANLGAGDYAVTVHDIRGCSVQKNFTLISPTLVSSSFSSINQVSCFDGNNGSFTINASGGTPGYSYSIDNINWQPLPFFAGLSATAYTVHIRDANQCLDHTSINLTSPSELILNVSEISHTTCNKNNGSATVSASGGVGGYTYEWIKDTIPLGNTASLTNMASGIYSAIVQDQNSCSTITQVIINDSDGPQPALVETTPASCYESSDGTATLAITGGLDPYIIAWPNGQQTVAGSNLSRGLHTVQITDANGCQAYYPVMISSPDPLLISESVTEPTCFGLADGMLAINASGGNGQYSYLWSNGKQTPLNDGIGAGVHSVTVTDAAGCSLLHEIELTEPALLTIDTLEMGKPSCHGFTDGYIKVSAHGGNGAFQFLWDNQQVGSIAGNLAQGDYQVIVTDLLGCITSRSFALSEPEVLSVAVVSSRPPSCFGLADGYIEVSGVGGNGNYQYLWATTEEEAKRVGLAKGEYHVMVRDRKTCEAEKTILFTEPSLLQMGWVEIKNPSCHGSNDGVIEVVGTGGVQPYHYQWSNASTGARVSNFTAGNQQAILTDANGCTTVESFILTQPQPLQIEIIKTIHPTCYGYADGLIEVAGSGGNGQYTYQWKSAGTGNLTTGLKSGEYEVTINDKLGCSTAQSITILDPEQLTVSLGTDQVICPGSSIQLTSQANRTVLYYWTGPGDFQSTSAEVSVHQAGSYQIKVTDEKGCTAQDDLLVSISNSLLKADFLSVSQGFVNDTIVLIDISWPLPETLNWNYRPATVISEENGIAFISYASPGLYDVTLNTTLGECRDRFSKTIQILEGNREVNGRVEGDAFTITVHPNPFSDRFTVIVEQTLAQEVSLQLLHFGSNKIMIQDKIMESAFFEREYALPHVDPGMYVLVIKRGDKIKIVRILKI